MTEMSAVEVTMHIPAAPEDIFPYFTDPARYVQWMGSEAKLEPVPGGVHRIQMPDGFEAAGEFLQVTAGAVFHDAPGELTRARAALQFIDSTDALGDLCCARAVINARGGKPG
jgi:uncharacterized protein YndB with AHSA1/START domain